MTLYSFVCCSLKGSVTCRRVVRPCVILSVVLILLEDGMKKNVGFEQNSEQSILTELVRYWG